eukprot:scaffold262_cov230-Pinguiococcus_pyrenoidosus.AAC.21
MAQGDRSSMPSALWPKSSFGILPMKIAVLKCGDAGTSNHVVYCPFMRGIRCIPNDHFGHDRFLPFPLASSFRFGR